YLHEVREVVEHLRTWAPAVVKTEGVEELLSAGDDVRWYSLKMFPQEDTDLLEEDEAIEYTGRTVQTLREWRRSGGVEFIKDNYGIMYSRESLDLMLEIKRGNSARNNLMRGKGA